MSGARGKIGGTDIAAIMNADPRHSAHDLWAWLTGKVEPQPDFDNEPMAIGREQEPLLRKWASKTLDLKISRATHRRVAEAGDVPFIVQIDGIIEDGRVFEAKTVGLGGPAKTGDWGDPATDRVPIVTIYQTHGEMMAAGPDCPEAVVGSHIGMRGRSLYFVSRNKDLCSFILEAVCHFWIDHVLKDTPPENSGLSMQIIKILKRTPDKVVAMLPAPVTRFETAQNVKQLAKEEYDQAWLEVAQQLGDAEYGETSDGRVITYYKQTKKAHQVKKSTFRVLRVKERKG